MLVRMKLRLTPLPRSKPVFVEKIQKAHILVGFFYVTHLTSNFSIYNFLP